jgi:hypothetical protein
MSLRPIHTADERFVQFSASLGTSTFPESAKPERIDALLHEVTDEWEKFPK